ncbi:MAG: hypothetical protein KJN93_10165, partial [Alphaproteobacteria bacterium]|nr:hypothetical protein [Alphaproteobacteria bacterium]
LAKMHGMWTARALNIISMNNVTTAQLMSVAVGSEALLMTTTELTATAALAGTHITTHGAQHCPPRTSGLAAVVEAVIWTAPCTAWHAGVAVPATLAATRAGDINSDFDPRHGVETAEKALNAIDGMNKALAARHPRAMAEHAESYYQILELDDHHFADPCDGPGLGRRCDRTDTGDGMALPIEEAGNEAYVQLFGFMERGVTSTFRERGFGMFEGPLSHGGTNRRPHLRDHINHVTEIGTALYEFKRFYSSRIAHLPRHPFAGPGNAIGGDYQPPGEAPDEETPFDDDTTDLLDSLEEIMENADDITQSVLRVLRNLPLAYDRHPNWANLQGRQSRRNPNSFTRNFRFLHVSVMAPEARTHIPISLIPFVTAVSVPETFQLEGISPLNPLPPFEATTMPDAYRVLAFGLKEKSRRLGEAVMTTPVTTHTGYAQAGVFNPDGATLYTQNWHTRLMPATRMDEPRDAGRDLARQARSGFDDLAEDLQQVRDVSTWERINAH